MLDPRDIALHTTYPVIAAPRFGPLEPLPEPGMRMVLAANGLFVQVQRPWLDAILLVGALDAYLPLPYGCLAERVTTCIGTLPRQLLDEFIAAARAALPNELSAALVWSDSTNRLRLVINEAYESSPQSVCYRVPRVASDEALVLDLHSHGWGRASFSDEDDADDASLKLAGVFGDLDRPQPSAAFRLCVYRLYRSLPNPWEIPR